ncbi:Pro-Pol polyprotein [Lonchura striata]|uniref:ribonuclease H n=1 Tax=Lonchura striata TaxID=40157 RepID=A0A218VDZ7_9PASE|nr:Pro-Pol polyprotein [Lonchura striata domestica]
MLWSLANLGPSQYTTFIATINADAHRETVGSVANKLRNYESMINGPMHAHISAVIKEFKEEMREEIRKGEARENRIFWTVWIRWPGTSEPQKYDALVDTGAQCTLIPSGHVGAEPVSIAGVTGITTIDSGGNRGIDFLRNGYYKDPKGLRWAFGIAAVEAEDIKQLNTLPGLSENPSAVGLLRVEEQRVPIATSTVHCRQYQTDGDAVIPIHKMIRELESQGVVSKTHSPFNSPIWPVCKSDKEWRLTVDYCGLNEQNAGLSSLSPGGAYTWNRLPQGWKHSPTICHGLIQTALEKGEAPEHLQYIDDIIVWGSTAAEVFERGERIIQILLKAGFTIKKSKVKEPAREIQFLGVKWQDGRRQIPTEVVNKITAMSAPTSKKETQAFLGAIGFWRMHIPEYSQIVSPPYLVTRTKNDFHWGPEQQQAFTQIKQEFAHAVALGLVRTGPAVKNVLYSAAGNHGLSWSLWQKVPGETRGRPLGFWSRSYRGSEANYTPTEKEILSAFEGVQATSESKWIVLITQRARIGNLNRPGILERITNWPEGENFGLTDDEEQVLVARAEEAPPYNQLPAEETCYALFTDGSCRIVGMNWKWKAAIWSPTRQVAQATEGEGRSSQLAELKAVQLALDIAEREKWPKLYLYTDSWMVANALWGWLGRWRKANWHRRGKPIWAADIWKDIASRVEKLTVKVRHGRDATYKWARDRGVDLTMDSVSQVIHDCETCAAIKQAKRVKPLWYSGRWSKYKYGEAWQIDYITLPQTRQGKRYMLTMVEATTGWLETFPVPHATARNTILSLEKQVLWRHGTPERIESDKGTHFKNSLINTWAREHEERRSKTTVSMPTQTATKEEETSSETASVSIQTVTEEEGTKCETASVSTQTVTEEEENESTINISTQTITEPEQPEPVAVAPVQKKKSKSKSVCIVTDEDTAGPLHPAEETEPEIITRSLSLGELRDL